MGMIKAKIDHDKIALGLIFLGIALRLFVFLQNIPLSFDGSRLAMDVVSGAFWRTDTFTNPPLSVTPLGFAVAQQYVVNIFGHHDQAFYLFPFLCGIAFLPVFYFFCRIFCKNKYSLRLAMLFASCSPAMIYFSSSAKQYILDPLIFIICCLFLYYIEQVKKQEALVALISFLLIATLFTFSIGFIVAIAYIYLLMILNEKRQLVLLSVASLVGTVSAVTYLTKIFDYQYALNPLLNMWIGMGGFPAASLGLKGFFSWALSVWRDFSFFSTGLPLILFIPFLFWSLLIAWKCQRRYMILFFLPILLVFLSASLHLYPFCARLLLFALPGFWLIFSNGITDLLSRFITTRRVYLLLGIFFIPVIMLGDGLHLDYSSFSFKALEFVDKHSMPGDGAFLDDTTYGQYPRIAYRYNMLFNPIRTPYGFSITDYKNAALIPAGVYNNILLRPLLKGYKRVWFIFDDRNCIREHKQYITNYFKHYIISEYPMAYSTILLVDFSRFDRDAYKDFSFQRDKELKGEISRLINAREKNFSLISLLENKVWSDGFYRKGFRRNLRFCVVRNFFDIKIPQAEKDSLDIDMRRVSLGLYDFYDAIKFTSHKMFRNIRKRMKRVFAVYDNRFAALVKNQ